MFVAYSHHDADYANTLREQLLAAGVEVVSDTVFGVASMTEQERSSISQCTHLIVVLSPEAARSKHVELEIRLAFDDDKPIIPIELRSVTRHELPAVIQSIRSVDARDGKDPLPYLLRLLLQPLAPESSETSTSVGSKKQSALPSMLRGLRPSRTDVGGGEPTSTSSKKPHAEPSSGEGNYLLVGLMLAFNGRDEEDASRLANRLRNVAVDVWCAAVPGTIDPGVNYWEQIHARIQECRVFAALLSPGPHRGGLVEEIHAAKERYNESEVAEPRIVPVRLTPGAVVPTRIKEFQAVTLDPEWRKKDDAYFRALVSAWGVGAASRSPRKP